MASSFTSPIGELTDPSNWGEDVKLNMDNSHIWSHRVGLMLRHHNLNKYIRIKDSDISDTPSEEDVARLSLASSYIQQTMSSPLLALFVKDNEEVLHDSRKLWMKIAASELLIPKGKAAFIRFHIQLDNLRLMNFKDPAEFLAKSVEIQELRAATEVSLTGNLEIIVALVKNLPRDLSDLAVKWRLGDYEGLTAVEAATQIKNAEAVFNSLPRIERPTERSRDVRRSDHREPRRDSGRRRGGDRRGSERRSDGRRVVRH